MSPTATVMNDLSRAGARSLLEIVSVTTGEPISSNVDVRGFARYGRFVYASESQCSLLESTAGFPTLRQVERHVRAVTDPFDVVFIDPWHQVVDTLTLIRVAFEVVRDGGLLIIHDCHPHDQNLRLPQPPGLFEAWCGETWKVWHRFVCELDDAHTWRTIDHDQGIGVLVRPHGRTAKQRLRGALRGLGCRSASWWESVEWVPEAQHLHLSPELAIRDMMSA